MQNPFAVTLSPTEKNKVLQFPGASSDLLAENKQLKADLSYERRIRYDAERKVEELTALLDEYTTKSKPKQAKTKEKLQPGEYSEYLPDGRRKARAAQPIRSYEDFAAIQNYFLSKKDIRDWALWTIGVSLGLRISDLLSLKIEQVLNPDNSFRDRILIVEQKTRKLNNCLITESVKTSLQKYFDSVGWKFSRDDYVFKSQKTGGKMYEEYGWKILSDAGKAAGLPIIIGSHTMRKSFANIAACVDRSSVDMNSITKVQGLLNHSDQRVTMQYLKTYQQMYDKAREAVSDFVLGKTEIHELVAGTGISLDDIAAKLDTLEQSLLKKQN